MIDRDNNCPSFINNNNNNNNCPSLSFFTRFCTRGVKELNKDFLVVNTSCMLVELGSY